MHIGRERLIRTKEPELGRHSPSHSRNLRVSLPGLLHSLLVSCPGSIRGEKSMRRERGGLRRFGLRGRVARVWYCMLRITRCGGMISSLVLVWMCGGVGVDFWMERKVRCFMLGNLTRMLCGWLL